MKREAFLLKVESEHRQFGFKNLIYVDETGFSSHTHRDYGWALKGAKVYGDFKGTRGRRTNLIMAQRHAAKGRPKEYLAPMLFQGSCTAKLVETWVKDHLMKELYEPTIVVMDNASFHRHDKIQEILAKDYHYLIPMAPYSPDLNPIEKTFAKLKKRRIGLPPDTTIDQLIMSLF